MFLILVLFGSVQNVHGVTWSMRKGPWHLVILGPVQKVLKTFGPHQNILDIFCCPEPFVMDPIHCRMFWTWSHIKDVLAWIRSLNGCSGHDQESADMNKVLFSCYTGNKSFLSFLCRQSFRIQIFLFYLTTSGLGWHICHLQRIMLGLLLRSTDSSCGLRAQELWCEGLLSPWNVGPYFPSQGLNLCPLHHKADS